MEHFSISGVGSNKLEKVSKENKAELSERREETVVPQIRERGRKKTKHEEILALHSLS